MSGSVNKVTLLGRLGKDVEVRNFTNGGKMCTFSVATSETWKNSDGEKQERTEWHKVSIFAEPLVKVAEQYLRKGSKVYLCGQLETRKWQDQSGNDRYSTEIVLRPYRSELVLLDKRDDNGGQRDGGYGEEVARMAKDVGVGGGAGGYGGGDLGDDIPFGMEWR